ANPNGSTRALPHSQPSLASNSRRSEVIGLRGAGLPRSVRPAQRASSIRQKRRSTTEWIDLISQAWTQRTADTLAVNLGLARLVSRARESLRARGEWSHLFGPGQSGLPFSKRKAEHFVRIGGIFGECGNANTGAQVPVGV